MHSFITIAVTLCRHRMFNISLFCFIVCFVLFCFFCDDNFTFVIIAFVAFHGIGAKKKPIRIAPNRTVGGTNARAHG